jgi:DNA-binding IclR family transcriptional regulator
VSSAQRTLVVFEEVVRNQPVALSDVARTLDEPVATVHRALQALAAEGWVRQLAPGKRWVVTARIEALVGRRHAELAEAVRPALTRLRDATKESAQVSVVDGDDMVAVAVVDSDAMLRVVGSTGHRFPLHELANGKAVLARMDEHECRRHLERVGADSPDLLDELSRIRRVGYAVNHGGYDVGMSAVGAAIVDPSGFPFAGIGVYGPRERIEPQVDAIAPCVIDAAAEIELVLAERAR